MTTYSYSLRFDITPTAAQSILEQETKSQSDLKRSIFSYVLDDLSSNGFEVDQAIASLEHPFSNAHFQCCLWGPTLLTHKLRNKIGTSYHKLVLSGNGGTDNSFLRSKDPSKKKDQIFSLTKARKPMQLANYCLKEDKDPILINIDSDFLELIKQHVSIKVLNNQFKQALLDAVNLEQVTPTSKKVLYFDFDSEKNHMVCSPASFFFVNKIHVAIFGGYITRRKYWSTLHQLELISDDTYCREMNIFRNY